MVKSIELSNQLKRVFAVLFNNKLGATSQFDCDGCLSRSRSVCFQQGRKLGGLALGSNIKSTFFAEFHRPIVPRTLHVGIMYRRHCVD